MGIAKLILAIVGKRNAKIMVNQIYDSLVGPVHSNSQLVMSDPGMVNVPVTR